MLILGSKILFDFNDHGEKARQSFESASGNRKRIMSSEERETGDLLLNWIDVHDAAAVLMGEKSRRRS